LFRVSVQFIDIDPKVWIALSSGIIVFYGLTLLFPTYRDKISLRIFWNKSSTLTEKAGSYDGRLGDILLGASLWPLFSTCSPTYALLFSVILPTSFLFGLVCMIAYVLGFGLILYIFVAGGKKIIRKFYPLANSHGIFKKTLGILLIVIGALIFTGKILNLESSVVKYLPDLTRVEHFFIKELNLGITK
jgi:cytochrome c-type biogenesis protein